MHYKMSVQATTISHYYLNNNGVTQSFSVSASASSYGDVNNVDNLVELASKLSIGYAFQYAHAILANAEVTAPLSIYVNTGDINFTSQTTTVQTIM
jgi:hypothetical protein